MALPSVLSGQETINPFAQLALQNALQQSQESAQQQYSSALEQLATTPAMTQQVDSTLKPETNAAPASLANNPNRRGFNNLGFSNLNAYAAATPQLSFTPTTIPGGAFAQGLTNMFNVRESRQAQNNIMQMMQQQQAAAQQQAMAEQQAKQQLFQQKVAGLMGLPYMTLERATGIVASGQADQVYGAFKALADAQAANDVGMYRQQQLAQQIPGLARPGQDNPLAPTQQVYANTLIGAPAAAFNQYQPMTNREQFQEQRAKTRLAETQAGAAPQLAAQSIESGAVNIQGAKLDNALKAINNQFAPQQKQIELLVSQGKLDEAQNKQQTLDMAMQTIQSLDFATATPQDIARINGILSVAGITAKIPEMKAPEVIKQKTGKNTEALFYQTPQGLVPVMQETGGGWFNGPKQLVPVAPPGMPVPIVLPGMATPVPIVMPQAAAEKAPKEVKPKTKPTIKTPVSGGYQRDPFNVGTL